jgi:hypothetical protein
MSFLVMLRGTFETIKNGTEAGEDIQKKMTQGYSS